MRPSTVQIFTAALLPDLSIIAKDIQLDKVTLSDMENVKTVY